MPSILRIQCGIIIPLSYFTDEETEPQKLSVSGAGSLITSAKTEESPYKISLQSDQPGARHKATYDEYPLNE